MPVHSLAPAKTGPALSPRMNSRFRSTGFRVLVIDDLVMGNGGLTFIILTTQAPGAAQDWVAWEIRTLEVRSEGLSMLP